MKLLISPLAKGAYFADYLEVARAELRVLAPTSTATLERVGPLDFIVADVPKERLPVVTRASFLQGLFEEVGAQLLPSELAPDFAHSEDLVFGSKYQGKTSELVTQLAINLAMSLCDRPPRSLLDPMAGQGTSLLWSLRYGLNARGVELETSALDALQRHFKKQAKLHKIKHQPSSGYVGTRNRKGWGRFVRYEVGGRYLQLIAGDSADAGTLLGGQRFDIVVADLPYGVQFRGRGPHGDLTDSVRRCATGWVASLRPGGSMTLIFNRYQPKRATLIDIFTSEGLKAEPFEAPHRMSESIVRDLLAFTKPGPKL